MYVIIILCYSHKGLSQTLYTSLDKNLNFLHAGNLKDRAEFSAHFIYLHEMLPYPLLDMCRKCEEISCFGKQYT